MRRRSRISSFSFEFNKRTIDNTPSKDLLLRSNVQKKFDFSVITELGALIQVPDSIDLNAVNNMIKIVRSFLSTGNRPLR